MDLTGFFTGFGWITLACLVIGLILVIVEMFHPGFSAPGIVGSLLLITGIVLYSKSLLQALILIVIILALLGAALAIVLQSAAKGHLARHLVLYDSLDHNDKFSSSDDLKYFIGKEGTALTVLRPSGTADFDGVRLDVVSEGEFIPKAAAIRITKIEGHRIVVTEMNQI